MSSTRTPISRRALLTRLGLAAGAVYVAPSLTSIGMARASGASGNSNAGPSGNGSSGPSRSNSGPSRSNSGPSRNTSRPSRGARGRDDAQAPRWLRDMFQR